MLATGVMVTVIGRSSAAVVLPLRPGKAPTMTPSTVPARMTHSM
jgi:hypothetical protein